MVCMLFRRHAKPTWHFGRISSLWSLAPPGPLENMDPACFPSAGPQTELNKVCCTVLPKGPSLSVTPTNNPPLLQLYVHQAGLQSLSQNLEGHSPRSGRLFPSTVLHPHTSSPWEPHILASAQRHFVWLFFLIITGHHII